MAIAKAPPRLRALLAAAITGASVPGVAPLPPPPMQAAVAGAPDPETGLPSFCDLPEVSFSQYCVASDEEAAKDFRAAAARRKKGEGGCIPDSMLRHYDKNIDGGDVGYPPLTPSINTSHRLELVKVFYINLDSSLERREFMENQLKKAGVDYERFPAVDAHDVAAGKYDKILEGYGMPTKEKSGHGTLACGLSHHLLQEKILREHPGDDRLFLYLEDDATLADGWQQKLIEDMRHVPEDWTVVQAGIWGAARCGDLVNERVALVRAPWRQAVHYKMPSMSFHCNDRFCGECRGGGQKPVECNAWMYMGATAVVLSPVTIPTLDYRLHLPEQWRLEHQDADATLVSLGPERTYALLWPIAVQGEIGSSDRIKNDANYFNKDAVGPSIAGLREQIQPAWQRRPAALVACASGAVGAALLGALAAVTRAWRNRENGHAELEASIEPLSGPID